MPPLPPPPSPPSLQLLFNEAGYEVPPTPVTLSVPASDSLVHHLPHDDLRELRELYQATSWSPEDSKRALQELAAQEAAAGAAAAAGVGDTAGVVVGGAVSGSGGGDWERGDGSGSSSSTGRINAVAAALSSSPSSASEDEVREEEEEEEGGGGRAGEREGEEEKGEGKFWEVGGWEGSLEAETGLAAHADWQCGEVEEGGQEETGVVEGTPCLVATALGSGPRVGSETESGRESSGAGEGGAAKARADGRRSLGEIGVRGGRGRGVNGVSLERVRQSSGRGRVMEGQENAAADGRAGAEKREPLRGEGGDQAGRMDGMVMSDRAMGGREGGDTVRCGESLHKSASGEERRSGGEGGQGGGAPTSAGLQWQRRERFVRGIRVMIPGSEGEGREEAGEARSGQGSRSMPRSSTLPSTAAPAGREDATVVRRVSEERGQPILPRMAAASAQAVSALPVTRDCLSTATSSPQPTALATAGPSGVSGLVREAAAARGAVASREAAPG